jgi:iron complex transport system permease protein
LASQVSPTQSTATSRQPVLQRFHALFVNEDSPTVRWIFPLAAIAVLLGSMLLGTSIGAVHISPRAVLDIVFGTHTGASPAERLILLHVRLPRVLAAAVIGAALSVAGVLFQGLFRNPMAEPYVLGTSGGAAFGAAIGVFLFPYTSILGFSAAASLAFVGSIVTIMCVYGVARVGGRTPPVPLLLAGLAISVVLTESSSAFVYLRDEISWNARNLALWLQGSIGTVGWTQLFVAGGMLGCGLLFSIPLRRILNVLALGEEYALQLGIRLELARVAIIVVASLLTSAAVLLGGVIAFVGLLIPHLVRLLIGPEHGRLLAYSAVCGASYLILADAFARTVIAPAELPVGILTAFLGGPLLLYLLRRTKREYAL